MDLLDQPPARPGQTQVRLQAAGTEDIRHVVGNPDHTQPKLVVGAQGRRRRVARRVPQDVGRLPSEDMREASGTVGLMDLLHGGGHHDSGAMRVEKVVRISERLDVCDRAASHPAVNARRHLHLDVACGQLGGIHAVDDHGRILDRERVPVGSPVLLGRLGSAPSARHRATGAGRPGRQARGGADDGPTQERSSVHGCSPPARVAGAAVNPRTRGSEDRAWCEDPAGQPGSSVSSSPQSPPWPHRHAPRLRFASRGRATHRS